MLLSRHFSHSPGSGPALRIGILLDQPDSGPNSPDLLAKPFANVLESIAQCDFADLVLRIYNTPAVTPVAAPVKRNALQKIFHLLGRADKRKYLLWAAYQKLDSRQSPEESALLAPVDITARIKDIPRLDVTPISKGFTHRFPEDALAEIRSYNLDVLIRFGFNILRGEILTTPRYGIWSYHHGDNDFYRGGPAHYWEMVEKNPQSGVILQILNEKLDDGLVLCKGTAATENTILLSKNRVAPYLLSQTFMIRKLRELHSLGWPEVQKRAVPPQPYQGKRKLYRTPTNIEVAKFLAPVFIGKGINRAFRKPTFQHWRIALRVGGRLDPTKSSPDALHGFRWLDSPRGRFWADPFLLQRDGKTFCFFEDLNYATGIGRISCGEVTPEAALENVRPVLAPKYHLSYPFIFQDGSEIYMIPEGIQSGGTDLYRARRFPDQWEHVTRILDTPGIDTTIVQREGLYWLFTTLRESDHSAGQLALMYSRNLTGPYQFHTLTPLSADARYSRCGGRIIELNGDLIRPSQDACNGYGCALHFRRITKMNALEYEEEFLYTLNPPEQFQGLHHYDRANEVEVVDGRRAELTSLYVKGGAPEPEFVPQTEREAATIS